MGPSKNCPPGIGTMKGVGKGGPTHQKGGILRKNGKSRPGQPGLNFFTKEAQKKGGDKSQTVPCQTKGNEASSRQKKNGGQT